MNDARAVGPIDFVLLEFPDEAPATEAGKALLDLVDTGIVKLYDIAGIRKAADGTVSGFELTGDEFSAFAGARSGLVDDSDITEAASALEPGTKAFLLVYENAWAAPFVAATMRAGGQLVASARIPAQAVVDALDALDAAAS